MENIINQLAALINDHLFADFKPQYPKDEICWSELKAKLDDLADLRFKLLSFTERASEDSSATEGGKEELIEKAFTIPAPLWRAIAEWGETNWKAFYDREDARIRLCREATLFNQVKNFRNGRKSYRVGTKS